MATLTTTNRYLIDAYERRFEELYGDRQGHLWFACHAVFPSMMSPHLLYQIWYNFRIWEDEEGNYQEIPREVVSDFIHSGLCKPVRNQLYSVDDELRVYLLAKLKDRFGEARLQQLAHFLSAYLLDPGSLSIRKHSRQLHEWIIEATLEPSSAALAVQKALTEALEKGNRREQLRLFNVLDSLRHHSSAFDELHQYAGKLAETIQRQDQGNTLLPAISLEDTPGLNLVKMPITEALKSKIGRTRKEGLTTNPEIAKRIETFKKEGATMLDLSGLGLTKLPTELWELKDLRWLNLKENSFKRFPAGLHHFPKLVHLNLSRNLIETVGIEILECPQLERLNLSNNLLNYLPEVMCGLKSYRSQKLMPIHISLRIRPSFKVIGLVMYLQITMT